MENSDRSESSSSQASNAALPAASEPVEVRRGRYRGIDTVTYQVPGGFVALGTTADGHFRLRNRFPAPTALAAEWELHELIDAFKFDEPTAPGGSHFLPGEYPAVSDAELIKIGGGS